MDVPISFATGGGKAFPTCLYAAVFFPANFHCFGKPCINAAMLRVKRGFPSKSSTGEWSANPIPSIPISAHAFLALVGPIIACYGLPIFLLQPFFSFLFRQPSYIQRFCKCNFRNVKIDCQCFPFGISYYSFITCFNFYIKVYIIP